MIELIAPTTDKIEAPVAQIKRADATPLNAYNHEANSVPYVYGVYGDEKQGLIKGSMGVVIGEAAKQFEGETAEQIEKGIITQETRHILDNDYHTVAVKDGNCSIPVGIVGNGHKELNPETGLFEGDEKEMLWYGAAVPQGLLWEVHNRSLQYANHMGNEAKKYADSLSYGGDTISLPFGADMNKNSVFQESEKDDTAVKLSFTEVRNDSVKQQCAKTYNRLTDTGVNATSLGSSIATGKRSFAAGSSNIAANEKAFATGCDNIAFGKQTFTAGYANAAVGDSSATIGQQNIATGSSSIATGLQTTANGLFSFTAGNNTIANNPNQFVCGKFNDNKQNTVFEVGYGYDNNSRVNVFEVYVNGDIAIGNLKFTQEKLAKLHELLSQV